MKFLTIAAVFTLATSICFSQTLQPAIIEDFKPSVLNQPGQEYPRVNSQGYARFKIILPSGVICGVTSSFKLALRNAIAVAPLEVAC